MASTHVYLVRHGEQDPATGHAPDGGLSPLGREQAGRVGAGRPPALVSFNDTGHLAS